MIIEEESNMTAREYGLGGYELLKKEEWDAAVEWYTTALAEYPEDTYLIGCRCDAWVRKGEPEKALAEYTRLINKEYPRPSAAHEEDIKSSNGLTRFSGDIQRAGAYNSRGLLYQELGDYDKAIADFSEAIPLVWSNYGTYLTNRGMVYRVKGDLDAAMADMNAAMEAWDGPEATSWTLYQRSLVWQAKGDMDKALADLVQATVNEPEDHEAFYHLGSFLITRNEPEKATEAFSKAIELNDDDAYYWLARGVSYWNTCVKNKIGFWDKEGDIMNLAIHDFTKAIECDPAMADAYFNRGMVRCSNARECNNLIKAIVNDKATDEAERVLMLAQLTRIGGKELVPQADAILRGLRSNRDEVDVLIAKGVGLAAEDDAREAVEDLTQAVTLDPKNAEAYYQRGLAYTLLGEKDKALADYDQTCALAPVHARAAEKRKELLSGK
jgi:tetratricopeptide (TPR) repeat protein